LLVSKRYKSAILDDLLQPEFEWEKKPDQYKGKATYGLLNRGVSVVVTDVIQVSGFLKQERLDWRTFTLENTTNVRQVYHGKWASAVPVPSKSARSSTPFFETWLYVNSEVGRKVIICYTDPISKQSSKIVFSPENLPVAAQKAFQKEQDAQ
jgi:hypothetical protein